MSHCPSCGRYTGPQEACPYCGASRAGRLSLQKVRVLTIVLVSVGLGVLWSVARQVEPPLVRAGEINSAMNLATVRLQGRCVRGPSYDSTTEYLSFWLDDGTGEVRVSAYRAETRALVARGRLPAVGDLLEVAGTLRLQPDLMSLTLNVPDELLIERSPPVDREIGSLSAADEYLRVRVRGQVRELREPYSGLTLITLHDGTGEVTVSLADDLHALSGTVLALSPGETVEVVGAVSLYRDVPQLVPASAVDVVALAEPLALAPKPVGSLGSGDAGNLVCLQGTVAEAEPFSAGIRLLLDDGTGTMNVVLWETVHQGIPFQDVLAPGASLRVVGELALYRGELELLPQLPMDILLVQEPSPPAEPEPTSTPVPVSMATPTATRTPVLRASVTPLPTSTPPPTRALEATVSRIGSLSADHVGAEVTVEGTVASASSFSHGFRFVLDDGSGQLTLVMWHEVYDDCWDGSQLNLGAEVRATGRLAHYEGELQIQPSRGADVKALRGATAWAPLRQIGSLAGGDAGQRVMVEGHVVRVEGLESAVKVFLADETGEIAVFLWRNVLDRVAGNVGLGTPGSRVRVVGALDIYRSNLELTPALPSDVNVVEMAQ